MVDAIGLGGWLALAGMSVAGALLPRLDLSLQRELAELAGSAGYALGTDARRGGASNLASILDRHDPDLVALRLREAFRAQAQNYLDLFRVPSLHLDDVERIVEMDGWEHLETALEHGRGAVLATLHLGNIDLVAQLACARGVSVIIPVEPISPRPLFEYVTRLRTAHGLRLLPIGRGSLSELMAAVKSGHVVGFAIDRDVQGSGRRLEFLGRPARISYAPALVALRTGAAIVPTSARRLRDGRFRARFDPPIWPPTEGRGAHAAARLMARVIPPLERAVRQNPGQWVMFQPLFQAPEAQ